MPLRMQSNPSRRALATVTAAAIASVAVTVTGTGVANAAPCDYWPPAQSPEDGSLSDPLGSLGTGTLGANSGGSISLGSADEQTPTVAPWHEGEGGYIPVLEGHTQTVELMTGRTSPNNTVDRFGITGTDLGILWDGGDGTVYMALGDTMGDCSLPDTQWRSNILFRSSDRDLSDGMTIDSAPMESEGMARAIIPRQNVPGEVTMIPTAGVEVDGTQYLRYMSVRSWGEPGEWTTNFSAIAMSDDRGENRNQVWENVPGSVRVGVPQGRDLIPDDLVELGEADELTELTEPPQVQAGQMSAYLKDDGDNHVYEYMTPSGRNGEAILARTPESEFLDFDGYEYWNGTTWVEDVDAAESVIEAPVSELSVDYHEGLEQYIAMHTNATNDIVMRTAPQPEGPWSGTTMLLSHRAIPTMYGAYIHPWSTGSDLYFTMSTWDAYNVFLMRTDLDQLNQPSAFRTATADGPDPVLTGEQTLVERIEIPE